ncbi:MAG: NAD-dependent epimerase/dehydratase family protein [gamma proteobacterium symbiont of Bathyaustriella thionipta]|nr:NAD-dependent epimerase/dehydratase family protein [gamma proteobacterium symbiont of Bathyaustriella thionipta]
MSQSPQRVAITGASGFIGQNLLQQLSEPHYSLKVLLRSQPPQSILRQSNVEIVKGSLQDSGSLQQLVKGCDAVIHCAGAVRGVTEAQFNRTNEEGSARLAGIAASQSQPPRFLALSSLAAREPQLSAYANSKKRAENALTKAAGNMPWLALRPPAVYGPGDKEMLPLFQAMAKGIAPMITPRDARFSMIFVQDLVAVMHIWLQQETPATGIYELHDGHAQGYCFSQVVDVVRQISGKRVRTLNVPLALLSPLAAFNWVAGQLMSHYQPMLTPGKLRELGHHNWVCDNQALQKKLDWQPAFGLQEGLRATPGWQS